MHSSVLRLLAHIAHTETYLSGIPNSARAEDNAIYDWGLLLAIRGVLVWFGAAMCRIEQPTDRPNDGPINKVSQR